MNWYNQLRNSIERKICNKKYENVTLKISKPLLYIDALLFLLQNFQ